jgi:hypothetical protein
MTQVNKQEVVAEDLVGAEETVKYDQNNSGALFKNEKRMKDSHPNSRGKAMVGGKWYWISGWTKKSANDQPFISLAYTEMTEEDVAKYC